jgi:hypothetical protein
MNVQDFVVPVGKDSVAIQVIILKDSFFITCCLMKEDQLPIMNSLAVAMPTKYVYRFYKGQGRYRNHVIADRKRI